MGSGTGPDVTPALALLVAVTPRGQDGMSLAEERKEEDSAERPHPAIFLPQIHNSRAAQSPAGLLPYFLNPFSS